MVGFSKKTQLIFYVPFVVLGAVFIFLLLSDRAFLASFFPASEREKLLTQFLTKNRFQFLQLASFVVFTVYAVFLFFFLKKESFRISTEKLIRETLTLPRNFWSFHKHTFRLLSNQEKLFFGALLLLLLAGEILMIKCFGVHKDEAFNFVFLADRGPLLSAVYYPGPNNHILMTLTVSLAHYFMPPFWALKIPAFLTYSLFLLTAAGVLRRWFGSLTTAFALAVFGLSDLTLFFGTQARGYLLLCFWVLLAFHTLLRYFESGERKLLIAFILCSAAGFYTIPVFAFAFTALVTFQKLYFIIRKEKRKRVIRTLASSAIACFLAVLLYLPVLLLNAESFLSNRFIEPVSFSELFEKFPGYWQSIHNRFWDLQFGGVFFYALALFALWKKRKSDSGLAAFCMLSAPLLLLVFYPVLPFARVWLFLLFFEALGLAIAADFIFRKVRTEGATLVLVLLLVSGIAAFQWNKQFRNWQGNEKNVYLQIKKLSPKILEAEPKKLFVSEDTYSVMLRFAATEAKQKIEFLSRVEAQKHQPEFLIITKDNKLPKGFEGYGLWYADDFVLVFQKE